MRCARVRFWLIGLRPVSTRCSSSRSLRVKALTAAGGKIPRELRVKVSKSGRRKAEKAHKKEKAGSEGNRGKEDSRGHSKKKPRDGDRRHSTGSKSAKKKGKFDKHRK